MSEFAEIKIFQNLHEVFVKAAEDFFYRAINTIKNKGVFMVVLSGGNTPKLFYDILVESYKEKIPWNRIQFFFGDERYVPADDPNNNYHAACEHLFAKINIPFENIHPIPTQFESAQQAAVDYERTLHNFFHTRPNEFPKFDLIYLGLGDNAHTASLMPFSDVVKSYAEKSDLYKNSQLVASLYVPELKMDRITLTPPVINNSECITFLVTGLDKAQAVHAVIEGPRLPERYPAQLIHCTYGKNIWYLDQAAAEKLTVSTQH